MLWPCSVHSLAEPQTWHMLERYRRRSAVSARRSHKANTLEENGTLGPGNRHVTARQVRKPQVQSKKHPSGMHKS